LNNALKRKYFHSASLLSPRIDDLRNYCQEAKIAAVVVVVVVVANLIRLWRTYDSRDEK